MSEPMTRLPHSAKVCLEEWSFGLGDLDKAVAANFADAIEESLSSFPPVAFLPFQYGPQSDGINGPETDDPLLIYFSLPAFDANADYGLAWSISLRAIIADAIEDNSDEAKLMLSRALRTLANEIDSVTATTA